MSGRETKTKSTRGVKKTAGEREAADEREAVGAKGREAAVAQGFYVYCVGEREALAPLFDEELPGAIEGESGLELVGGGLAAVVSRVPLADYGEGALASRLEDATWTATRALRHERVVEHFARRASVAPLRFGTIYLRRESVERMLKERGAQMRSVLGRLEGREEWGVNVFVERARLREEVVNVSERLREMGERAALSSPGQGYLLRKKIESLRDEEARAETRRVASEVEARLAAVCDGAARLRVLKDEATEQGELAARFAFLVARPRFGDFRAAAERLAEEYTPLGFRFELTGPWPAYNFIEETGEGEKNTEEG
jgi:Gas vesicle synthesis protein GvpL/GvpF